jgi:hypothetical protein
MSDRYLEQRIDIKFCVKLGKNPNDAYAVLSKACGAEVMKNSKVSQ